MASAGYWIAIILLLGTVSRVTAGDQYVLGVIITEVSTVQNALRELNAEGVFQIEAIEVDESEGEFHRLLQIEQQFLSFNFYAVVGKYSRLVAMVSEKLRVPYLCDWLIEERGYTYGILPKPSEIWSAFHHILLKYEWKRTALLYEDISGICDIKNSLVDTLIDVRMWRIHTQESTDQMRELLLAMRNDDITNALVIGSPGMIRDILLQARRLGMIASPYVWLLCNLESGDISSNILDDLRVNISALTLPVVQSTDVDTALDVRALALHDALRILVDTARAFDMAGLVPSTGYDSTEVDDLIKRTPCRGGLTGDFQLGPDGRRSNYTLNVTSHVDNAFVKIGEWRCMSLVGEENTCSLKWVDATHTTKDKFTLQNMVVRVVSIVEKPFLMLKSNHEELEGNDKYEGYTMDLLTKIAEELRFRFEIYLVPDGQFGTETATGEWNGLIGQVLSGNASMTVAPISINREREVAIDFTKPFKTRGISVLMQKPSIAKSYFQFLSPLSTGTWLCISLCVLVVSCTLYIIEKTIAYMGPKRERLRVPDSIWIIFGSLVQGGPDISPRSHAGRILTSVWWLFALFMVSSYTANLAAFLTVRKINTPIKVMADLGKQTSITYGTVRSSGVEAFFKNTQIPAYAEMWTYMQDVFLNSMVNSTVDGIELVREGNYALVWEDTVTTYLSNTDCDFTSIGPPVDQKGYGIGLPPGTTYLEVLSLAILKLSDIGFTSQLDEKWWGTTLCPDTDSDDSTTELKLDNVAGIFFILAIGILLSICVCGATVLYEMRYRQKKPKKATSPQHNPNESTM